MVQPPQLVVEPPIGDYTPVESQVLVLPLPNPLPVTPRDQEGFYTCWAACAEMIMEFVGGISVRQCEQADRPFYESLCCDENLELTRDPDCDSPGLPEFGRWGFYCEQRFQQPLDWNEVKAEIDGGRPFAFSWTRTDPTTGASLGISHMLVVFGYEEAGPRVLVCFNPRPFAHTEVMLVPFEDYGYTGGVNPAATTPAATGLYVHDLDYFRVGGSP
jgi:hypothetical protein